MKKPWTAHQDYVVIGVTVNCGKHIDWPAGYCERVAIDISNGMDQDYQRGTEAVKAKADNVMFMVTNGAYGLSNASHRVVEWTKRYRNQDLKATVVVHQAMRDSGLEDLIPEEIRFVYSCEASFRRGIRILGTLDGAPKVENNAQPRTMD